MKYTVFGILTISVSIEVEAENEDDAYERADVEWPGIYGYAGNGRPHGALIGTGDNAVTLEATDEGPLWTGSEKNDV